MRQRQEVYPEAEDLQKELDWYEDLNTALIKLDLEYKALGVGYHCIESTVRDEIATGGTHKHQPVFEYVRRGEAPIPIKYVRTLDDIVRNARFMARRGRWYDLTTLRRGKEAATEVLENLKEVVSWIGEFYTHVERYDSTGRCAVVAGQGVARFNAMSPTQRSRFLHWASQMREVQIAKSTHSIKSVQDIVELMMGEEERAVLEWPEVTPEPR
ncbi:hypothetical protein MBLNU13_g08028t1 [Cladosporium sp. NU13]